MADTDTSSYILRYNLILAQPEYFNGSDWYVQNGEPTLLTLTGDVTASGTSTLSTTVHSAGGGAGAFAAGALTVLSIKGSAIPLKIIPFSASQNGVDFTDVTGTSSIMSVDASTGRIGIGTTAPGFKLDVNGQINTAQGVSYGIQFFTGTGSVTPNAAGGFEFMSVTVSGNLTINGPINGFDGQKIIIRIINDASHSVTFATGAGNFKFGTTIPSYTNSVSLTDDVGIIYNSATNLWHIVAVAQGF